VKFLSCFVPVLLTLAAAGCGRPPAPPVPSEPATPRLVSLAPSLTEIVFAIGASNCLVGRTTACTYPPEAAVVPIVGDFGAPGIERLASLHPTAVLEVDLADEAMAQKLDRLGIARRRVPCNRLDEIPSAIEEIGQLTGRDVEAVTLASALRATVARFRDRRPAEDRRPTVFVEIWHDPLTTVGRESFVADLVETAGGRNLGSAVETAYYAVSPEWVVARDPDVIVSFGMASGTNAVSVASRPGWSNLKAVRTGRVYAGLDGDVVLRPGPRVVDGIEALIRCIRPAESPP
jgi:iron complex transport system substrate-binding protein